MEKQQKTATNEIKLPNIGPLPIQPVLDHISQGNRRNRAAEQRSQQSVNLPAVSCE